MTRRTIEVPTGFGIMEAFADDLITDHLIQFGAHTRVELALLLSVVDPGDVVFDLGSHIGTYAFPLAQKIGAAGTVVAVEANEETFEVFVRNVRRMNATNVVPVNALIAPPLLRYEQRTREENTGATYFVPSECGLEHSTLTLGIDELCARYKLPRVMKLDLEGYEAHALLTTETVWPRRPIIYAEICCAHIERTGRTLDELDNHFCRLGYRLFRNAGDRNAAHDEFVVTEMTSLRSGGDFFDVLAVHRSDDRIDRLRKLCI